VKLQRSTRFTKQFRRLCKDDPRLVRQVEKTVQYLLRFPPAHPALRMKRIQGTPGIYECSVNMDIRVTFEFLDSETIVLRNIDRHDRALKRY
jgi:mRNA-degrading endonuclease YafQ of YafQ-DinJ toxin-antitoxin module